MSSNHPRRGDRLNSGNFFSSWDRSVRFCIDRLRKTSSESFMDLKIRLKSSEMTHVSCMTDRRIADERDCRVRSGPPFVSGVLRPRWRKNEDLLKPGEVDGRG